MLNRRTLLAAAALTAAASPAIAAPLREDWHDAARARTVPVLVRLPDASGPAPVVIVSHGLGGSREGLAYLGEALAAAGYVAVHLQHAGSDSAIWQGAADVRAAMSQAVMNPRAALDRLYDVAFALDELARHPRLAGSVDLARAAVAGHSFGAWTVSHMLGQRLPLAGFGPALPDPRLLAGVAFSPIPPIGIAPEAAYAGVAAPMLHVTGTEDRGAQAPDWRARTAGFRLSPAPGVLAVLAGANHAAFAGEPAAGAYWNNPAYHARAARLAVLFLDAVLQGSAASQAALLSGQGLAPGDRIEAKGFES